jgi:hypothetical protein
LKELSRVCPDNHPAVVSLFLVAQLVHSSAAPHLLRHIYVARVVASDHTPIGITRNVKVHPSDRIFDTIGRKLEEVEWLLNYARNANKPIPVASAITTKKVNAPRRSTPTRLLNPVTHHQTTKSAYVPEINTEALIPPYLSDLQLHRGQCRKDVLLMDFQQPLAIALI